MEFPLQLLPLGNEPEGKTPDVGEGPRPNHHDAMQDHHLVGGIKHETTPNTSWVTLHSSGHTSDDLPSTLHSFDLTLPRSVSLPHPIGCTFSTHFCFVATYIGVKYQLCRPSCWLERPLPGRCRARVLRRGTAGATTPAQYIYLRAKRRNGRKGGHFTLNGDGSRAPFLRE